MKEGRQIILTCCALFLGHGGHSQKPIPESLTLYANELYAQHLIEEDLFPVIKSGIASGDIGNGAIDFFRYLPNAMIIQLPELDSSERASHDHLLKIYKQLCSMVPGFKARKMVICDYWISNQPCRKGYSDFLEEPYKKNTAHWSAYIEDGTKKKDAGITSCEYCLDDPTDLIDIVNQLLKDEKSGYQVGYVEAYRFDGDSSIFLADIIGAIVLNEAQFKALKGFDSPYFMIHADFQRYITPENIRMGIESFKNIGLFDHLTETQIELGTRMAVEEKYTNFVDVLRLFPGLVYDHSDTKNPYPRLIKKLEEISGGTFRPSELQVITDPDNGEVKISFTVDGKKVESDFFSMGACSDLITLANAVLERDKADGRFVRLFPTRSAELNHISSSYIFVSTAQHEYLTGHNLWSIIPESGIQDDNWEEFKKQTIVSWEMFYLN